MELQTKYITCEDFTQYFGIDLNKKLPGDDNPSDKVNRFLKRLENRMEAFLNSQFYQNVNELYPEFTDYQKEHYKLALLEQAIYVFRNGDISVDSGLGETIQIDRPTIDKSRIALNAKDELILCGLWCRHIGFGSNGGRFGGLFL